VREEPPKPPKESYKPKKEWGREKPRKEWAKDKSKCIERPPRSRDIKRFKCL
jgi:hypothetical protein